MKKALFIAFAMGLTALLGYLLALDDTPETGPDPQHGMAAQTSCRDAAQHADMVWIEGGSYTRGSTDFYPDEGPPQQLAVDGFWIDRFEVTNGPLQRIR